MAPIGVIYIEEVDKIGKKSMLIGSSNNYHMSLSEINIRLREDLKKKWQISWSTFCSNNSSKYTKIRTNLPKYFWHKDYVMSIQYVTTMKPCHLHKIQYENCEHCLVSCDLDHIFFSCINDRNSIQDTYKEL